MLFDVFICHASEDKDKFVRPLAECLRGKHLEVWYDEFSLKVGDSLRRSIDKGLSKSRYGIVILSPNFLDKKWPQWELDGLVQRQVNEKANLILPIWHNISKEEVIAFSPSLADKVAIKSEDGIEDVVVQLLRTIQPEGSTLLTARDILLEYGYNPPVVTDDWWLDVVEFSASNDREETFQAAMGWGRWGFPLPARSDMPFERGSRLARAAMQMLWERKAEEDGISQVTHPNDVLKFISSVPGLAETCHEYIHYLAAYAPQLTIKGFGGEFEEDFDQWYKYSKKEQGKRRKACDELLALRHPAFGNYGPSNIACNFVIGDIMGPPVKVYDYIDYVVWFLSSQSSWMPRRVHQFLLQGLKDWAPWHQDLGPQPWEAINKAKSFKTFKLTKKCKNDIETRFEHAIHLLGLSETSNTLFGRFMEEGFIEAWFNRRKKNS